MEDMWNLKKTFIKNLKNIYFILSNAFYWYFLPSVLVELFGRTRLIYYHGLGYHHFEGTNFRKLKKNNGLKMLKNDELNDVEINFVYRIWNQYISNALVFSHQNIYLWRNIITYLNNYFIFLHFHQFLLKISI